ncbi:nitroreductase [Paenibacillus qinlingensis]|uniref:Nitroreductase n=1 Tax=Paenibacillus qinlingensis TaxID=1837343 RepID=A0ABU1NTD5_9BACL|nr:nitroreductase [Paenibacillus qinlingensis]MDR6550723.1 nitroreductase [Paenibacillus qinlingensis]
MTQPITGDESSVSIAHTIRARRTLREFTNEAVSEQLVMELLNDAVWAPNHGLREPWRFLFVPTEQKGAFIEHLLPAFDTAQAEKMRVYLHAQASAFLIVIMPDKGGHDKQWEEDLMASAALIQNFQLLAWERKLGVVWKTNDHNWNPFVRELLGVQSGEKITGMLHLGHFKEDQVPAPKKPRTRAELKTHIFGNITVREEPTNYEND